MFKNKKQVKIQKCSEKKVKVIYIYGPVETGTVESVYAMHLRRNIYHISPYRCMDIIEYHGEPVIILDEFYDSISIPYFIDYCESPSKWEPELYKKNVGPAYRIIYIISTIPLEKQYLDIQAYNPKLWRKFLSKIDQVRMFMPNGIVNIYKTVEQYFNRNKAFEEEDYDEDWY